MYGSGLSSDFRDFRFTWRGFFNWTGHHPAGVCWARCVTLYFLDWNQMRGPIGRYLSHRTGREVRIDGNLAVKLFTWQPSVDAGGVYVGNPKWVGTPQAARVKEFRVEFRLVPLFCGHLILPLVKIDEPDILLVRDADGRTNWDSGRRKIPTRPASCRPSSASWSTTAMCEIDDAVRKLHFTGTVTSEENRGGGRCGLHPEGRRHPEQEQVHGRCAGRAAAECGCQQAL